MGHWCYLSVIVCSFIGNFYHVFLFLNKLCCNDDICPVVLTVIAARYLSPKQVIVIFRDPATEYLFSFSSHPIAPQVVQPDFSHPVFVGCGGNTDFGALPTCCLTKQMSLAVTATFNTFLPIFLSVNP